MKKVTKNTMQNTKENSKKDHVTMLVFEKNMRLIANSFAKTDEKIEAGFTRCDNLFELILKEIRSVTGTFKENRLSISDLDLHAIKQERRIKELDLRVDVLERKMK